jgi:hypothetical protein
MSDAPLRRYGVAHREEIGATEYGAEHLVEHDERGVRENGLRLAGERNQRCKATLNLETRKMLSAYNRGFAGDRRITRAVNTLFTVRSDVELSDGLQPFDNIDQIPLSRRFRPFPQLGERRAILIVGDDEQRFQSGDRFWGRPSTRFL